MIGRWRHLAALAAAIGALQLAAAFGTDLERTIAYAMAAMLGVAIYSQGEHHLVDGPVVGNVLTGYLTGTVLGLVVASSLLSWVLSIPIDFALWRTGVVMWAAWAGVGTTVLSAFFVTGLLATLR